MIFFFLLTKEYFIVQLILVHVLLAYLTKEHIYLFRHVIFENESNFPYLHPIWYQFFTLDDFLCQTVLLYKTKCLLFSFQQKM